MDDKEINVGTPSHDVEAREFVKPMTKTCDVVLGT
jgi:hypothetical protein